MAFVWDDEDRSQAEMVKALAIRLQPAAGAWSNALRVRGMHVLCAGERTGSSEVYRLNGVDGVVLGTAFEACTHQAESTLAKKFFSNDESRQILASGCRS